MPEQAPQGSSATPNRWRQFSLRALMVLILLCAIGLLLWNRYVEPARRSQRLIAEVERLGGAVRAEAYDTSWSEIVFGKGYFIEIRELALPKARIDDDWLKHLQDTPRLSSLGLSHTAIGDAGLVHLRGLKELESLWLDHTKVTDAGLAPLEPLTQLKQLSLRGCRITDDGLGCLKNMTELEVLNLMDTMVSDTGIARLNGLAKLEILALDNTNVTHASLPHLKKLPVLRQVTIAGTGILPSSLWYELPRLENPKLSAKLADPTVIEFVETPLQDVVDYLKDYHRVEIVIDRPALQAAGVGSAARQTQRGPKRNIDVPITKTLRGVPLQAAWEEMLKRQGLKCGQWHEVLLITADKPKSTTLPRLVLAPNESLSKELAAALHSPAVIEFVEKPLPDVLSYLSDRYGLKFVVDENEIDGDSYRVTAHYRGIATATALEFVLNDLNLHAVIKDNKLHVHPGPVPPELQNVSHGK